MANKSKNQVLREVTEKYLSTLDPNNPPNPTTIESGLLEAIERQFDLENSVKQKGRAWPIPQTLHFSQIAGIINYLYPIRRIVCSGNNSVKGGDLLALYQKTGPDAGIYVTSEDEFRSICRPYNYQMTNREFDEIMTALRELAPRCTRCEDPDLIPVNNGIFHYKTKTLMPFDPDYVFIAKSRVDYNPNAINQPIYNLDDKTSWDVESWIADLSDDPEIVNVIWEVLGAILRPNVRWDKSAWFYSETGNNGKGTLCELMRNLVGEGSYASIPISNFSQDFMLEPLMRSNAIIVDENDVGGYIDRAANLKAVITNDVIQINRKFKLPISYKFHGFMVQCLNEFPRVKDKSDSFYRRQLFIPFSKCFTGHERKYIKSDYLHRKEVLEYVMFRVLNMNYYVLSTPQACKDILSEYKEFNDPVHAFWEEMSPQFAWDLVPFDFAYDLYKAWFKQNSPNGSIQGKIRFNKDLTNVVQSTGSDWTIDTGKRAIRPQGRMDWPEPLSLAYELKNWLNPSYTGADQEKKCLAPLKVSYRGLERTVPVGPPTGWNSGIKINTPAG